MLPEIVVGGSSLLLQRLAVALESEGRRASAERGRFAIALSGGSVATVFFPGLAACSDWTRTDFFWCDERAVPPSHADSNYAAARSAWLEPAGVPAARIHRMEAETPDLAAAAAAYAAELERTLGQPPRLDVALLGVGPDGHVASLFPGHPVLDEERRWVAAIEDSPKPPPRRLTLTMPVLAGAALVVVAATGAAKAAVVREALHDPRSALPLAVLRRHAGRLLLLLDGPAGAGLETSAGRP